ncbi:hypothetical protein TUM12370_19430 [Salmonella enterica subsp. enterica serovar Choleraesuis]|nr:hypothetical protein TUM12370_19430 [Salmonella enterica subsp. enterica serovar Choleraesuis]
MEFGIARPRQQQLGALRDIELAAFETLRAAGAVSGPAQASDITQLEQYFRDGLLLAAYEQAGTPVGFIAGMVIESWLYIAELDVHPHWQRQGVGRKLLQAAVDIATEQRLCGVALTTDRLVPFNAPFYCKLGFKVLTQECCPAWLQSKLQAERLQGLQSDRRVAMIRGE